jgi:predicted amidohydrolase
MTTMDEIKSNSEHKPRKVRVATVVFDSEVPYPGLERRKSEIEALIYDARRAAEGSYGSAHLDLVVLTEAILTSRAGEAADVALDFTRDVQEWASSLARATGSYLVVPLVRVADAKAGDYRNSAFLLDREGDVVGVYDKIHPVLDDDGAAFEEGITPGREVPVFECDFGRLGIQICFDMVYDDGWDLLREKGAEVVVWPTESPQRIRPAWRALMGNLYIVSAATRIESAVFSPIGVQLAAHTGEPGVLVHEIDLSYARLNYSSTLREGEALRERWGDRIGFIYSRQEDMGLFWSNDPERSIRSILAEAGLDVDLSEMVKRNQRALQPYGRLS